MAAEPSPNPEAIKKASNPIALRYWNQCLQNSSPTPQETPSSTPPPHPQALVTVPASHSVPASRRLVSSTNQPLSPPSPRRTTTPASIPTSTLSTTAGTLPSPQIVDMASKENKDFFSSRKNDNFAGTLTNGHNSNGSILPSSDTNGFFPQHTSVSSNQKFIGNSWTSNDKQATNGKHTNGYQVKSKHTNGYTGYTNLPSSPSSFQSRSRDTRSQTPNIFCKRSKAARDLDYDDVPPPRPAPPMQKADVLPPWSQPDYNIKPLLPALEPGRPGRRREVKKTLVIKAQANSRSSSLPPWSRRSAAPPARGQVDQQPSRAPSRPNWIKDRSSSPAPSPPTSPLTGYRSRTPWVNHQPDSYPETRPTQFILRKVTS